MTGYSDEKARRRSEEAGFLAHLAKAADPSELQALLGVLAREEAGHACTP